MKRSQRQNQRQRLQLVQGNCCYYCGRPFTRRRRPTLDHFIPKSQGGTDAQRNLRLACERCNKHKANVVVPDRPAPRRAMTYPILFRHNRPVTLEEWKQVVGQHGPICLCCGRNVKRDQAALIYLDYGGRYRPRHCRVAHQRCARRLPPVFSGEAKQLTFAYNTELARPRAADGETRPSKPLRTGAGQFVLPGFESLWLPAPVG